MIDVSNYKTLLSNELRITNKYFQHRTNYTTVECHKSWEIKISYKNNNSLNMNIHYVKCMKEAVLY